jgi:glycine/D-amino acid oxidase-like deaminating enzyme
MVGCCLALSLAGRGARVTLFEREKALLMRAATANEGRIHLGYVYASDPTLATARTMMTGALTFAPLLARHLEIAPEQFQVSEPSIYAVHRASQRSADEFAGYAAAVHAMLLDASAGSDRAYFGIDLRPPPRRWSEAERDAVFDPTTVGAAFDTAEVALESLAVAEVLRARVMADSRIELRFQRGVSAAIENGGHYLVESDGAEGRAREPFHHVVNALWDGRFAVDAASGLPPARQWLYRFKYGVRLRPPAGAPRLPNVNIVLGPFGEVVAYPGGTAHLTWYPYCMRQTSLDLVPPDWPVLLRGADGVRLAEDSLRALGEIVPAVRGLDPARVTDLSVRGGVIVAWGKTDIDDPASELHRRSEIGITTRGGYHSIDPGKLTLAPYFAERCADRIVAP